VNAFFWCRRRSTSAVQTFSVRLAYARRTKTFFSSLDYAGSICKSLGLDTTSSSQKMQHFIHITSQHKHGFRKCFYAPDWGYCPAESLQFSPCNRLLLLSAALKFFIHYTLYNTPLFADLQKKSYERPIKLTKNSSSTRRTPYRGPMWVFWDAEHSMPHHVPRLSLQAHLLVCVSFLRDQLPPSAACLNHPKLPSYEWCSKLPITSAGSHDTTCSISSLAAFLPRRLNKT